MSSGHSERAPDGGPVADFALPDALGLCPDHGGEFYLPLVEGDRSRCPVQGCDRLLVVYTPGEYRVVRIDGGVHFAVEINLRDLDAKV